MKRIICAIIFAGTLLSSMSGAALAKCSSCDARDAMACFDGDKDHVARGEAYKCPPKDSPPQVQKEKDTKIAPQPVPSAKP